MFSRSFRSSISYAIFYYFIEEDAEIYYARSFARAFCSMTAKLLESVGNVAGINILQHPLNIGGP